MGFLAKVVLVIAVIAVLIWLLSMLAGALIWVAIVGIIFSLIGLIVKLWLDGKSNKKKVIVTSDKRADKDAERALKKIEREINTQ